MKARANRAIVRNRLVLPCLMVVFLLLSLAYWWLDNLAHEIFGTALFLLLSWHIAVNRVWFKNLFRGRYGVARIITLGLHLFLIANMLVLIVTSIVISKSLFAFLPIPDSIYLREIHWFSAYWVIIIVGAHVGLHWRRVIGIVRVRVRSPSFTLAVPAARIAAALMVMFGVWSFSVLGVWTKLTFGYSLDFWDFTASVSPFFGHWAGVLALSAVLTHYFLAAFR